MKPRGRAAEPEAEPNATAQGEAQADEPTAELAPVIRLTQELAQQFRREADYYREGRNPCRPPDLAPACPRRSHVLPVYKLHRTRRPPDEGDGPAEDVRDIEVGSDEQAVLVAQAVAAEPERGLLALELQDETGRVLWRLSRGETVSERPGEL